MVMDKKPHPVSSHLPIFPRLIVEHLIDSGFSEAEIFESLSFSSHDLENESFRLNQKQHEQFIRRAIKLTGNRHLALDMKDQAIDATSNAVLILFATSGRIAKALRLITRYNPIYTRTLTSSLEDSDTGPVLIVEPHLDDELVKYFAMSSFLLFIDNFFKQALDGAHLVTHADLALPQPEGFDQVRKQFGFTLQFGCDYTHIHLDERLINKPLKKADPQTTRLITEFCEKQLTDLTAEMSVVGAVSKLVFEQISAPPSLDLAASKISLSSRSLRRHLQNSGTTYQSILSDARRTLAIKLLRETAEPVSAIAYEVGFEHPSHFGRAFKKWTGQSPSEFRANQH